MTSERQTVRCALLARATRLLGETTEQPWATYEETDQNGGKDRFGQGHADDAESAGPHAALTVTNALAGS